MTFLTARHTLSTALGHLASPWLSVAFFLLAAAGALATAYRWSDATLLMALPFALLGLNLGAAIATHARFRADAPLLLFHLALLALVLLFVYGRLTYFDGLAMVTRNTVFQGPFERETRGPLHGEGFRTLSFANDGFAARDPDLDALNRVRWQDPGSGRWLSAEINSDHPLLLGGYRIYPTTRNRGFSPRLSWQPAAGGPAELGTVQLPPPSTAQEDFPRGVVWYLSDNTELWAQVRTAVPTAVFLRRANLGADSLDHVLVIRQGEERHELRPGESAALAGGRLTYLSLDFWTGYRVTADPSGPWQIATILVAVGSLIVFYAGRLRQRIDDAVAVAGVQAVAEGS
jgi:cytochrome c biogenesis protein